MALQKLTMASLSLLDGGRLAAAFETALKNVESDCKDRPGVPTARSVVLRASFVPVLASNGDLESVDVIFDVTDTAPKVKSPRYNMTAQRDGFMFNELSKENAKQHTLDQAPPLQKVN